MDCFLARDNGFQTVMLNEKIKHGVQKPLQTVGIPWQIG